MLMRSRTPAEIVGRLGSQRPLRRADVRNRRQQTTLASTNEALPHERPSTGVGAGGGRDWTLDGFAELSKVPSGPRAEHPLLRSAGSTANIRGVGMRPLWSRCGRGAGSRLRSRSATVFPELRHDPQPADGAVGWLFGSRTPPRSSADLGSQRPEPYRRSVAMTAAMRLVDADGGAATRQPLRLYCGSLAKRA